MLGTHALGIPIISTPTNAFGFQVQRTPLPSEFQKATFGIGMDIIWNNPIKK